MEDTPEFLERLWDDLLSRQPDVILASYDRLDTASQHTVISHLQRMVNEPGWQPEQRESAQAALQALKNRIDREE